MYNKLFLLTMNELLHRHGCSSVFSLPEGLKELMSDITREVLREQPIKMYDFISNYLSVLLITREHGILAVKILDDLCDCRPTLAEHFHQIGFQRAEAELTAQIIQQEIEAFEPIDGKEKLKETQMLKKIMSKIHLDEETAAKVCQIIRNAYRDFWYRKKLLQQRLKEEPQEPWEVAAANTLEIYKKTKPSFSELTKATEKIQAAYRGYYVRKKLLKHLRPKVPAPKMAIPGPPIDIAASREIDLGPLVSVIVKEDPVVAMFEACTGPQLDLKYDPSRMITHVSDEESQEDTPKSDKSVDFFDTPLRPSMGESFAKEVLQIDRTKSSPDSIHSVSIKFPKSTVEIFSRPSHSVTKTHSPLSLQKMISFAQVPPEIIDDDVDVLDIAEELGGPRSDGDGESVSSVSTEPVMADMSDIDEVDEALSTPHEDD